MSRTLYQSLKISGILCVTLMLSETFIQTTFAQADLKKTTTKEMQAKIKADERAAIEEINQIEVRYRAAAKAVERAKLQADLKANAAEANLKPVHKKMTEATALQTKQLLASLKQAHLEIELLRSQATANSKDPITQVFRPKHVKPSTIANTLERLLGPNSIRISLPGNSQLMLRGSQKDLEEAKQIVSYLDLPQESPTAEKSSIPKTIMIRIFILSDAKDYVDEADINYAYHVLPEAVLNAIEQLGLEEQLFVVLQSNTSITINEDESAGFTIQGMPANLFNEHCTFNAQGEVMFDANNRIHLAMEACTKSMNVKQSHNNPQNQITGSMSAPLGHYLVLGTTNFDAGPSGPRMAYVVQMIETKSFAPDKE